MRRFSALFAFCLLSLTVIAQAPIPDTSKSDSTTPDPMPREWHAGWITHPSAPLREPLVLHFRHGLTLPAVPASYPVRVSADNRFILYVNGRRVGDGPARGDLTHWRYERFDLAPLLKAGENLITATVWNFGVFAPVAQFSDRTAFLLESEATGGTGISTGVGKSDGWKVEIEPGQRPMDRSTVSIQEYMASGPSEQLDAAHYDWDWDGAAESGTAWVPAASPMRDAVFAGVNRAHSWNAVGDNPWGLMPDQLPPMEYSSAPTGATVRSTTSDLRAFPAAPVTVPPNSHVQLMIDRKALTTAYPRLTVSGGKDADVLLTYAEALYDKDGHKGDRDEVGTRVALGIKDRFLPDGAEHRSFEPLWWRTWRYLELDIATKDQPLQLESLTAQFTAYPFKELASFKGDDPDLAKIWEISWRTARLDAHETYMDTPYYEQLQYIGDTRIQALISYSIANDDRLGRQAIQAFDWSRSPDGITRSRYPSNLPQFIPTFSLLWVDMLHDYWMYRPDPKLVRETLPDTRTVFEWYSKFEQPDGLLHETPWWSFIDWVPTGEIPTYDSHGESCVTTLEYLGALDDAAELEKTFGDQTLTTRYKARAARARSGIYDQCWVAERGLLADTPEKKVFSQQANILGALYDVIPKEKQQDVLRKMVDIYPGTTPDGVLSASYYFRFYLARALDHAGLGDEYLRSIGPWRKLLPLHFSTWPEIPGDTRSDSHAWSAHPAYDFLTLVAGIEPASPGFATVRIAPHFGALTSIVATYPHPQGNIEVSLQRNGADLTGTVTLPGSLTGTFVHDGNSQTLKPGVNRILSR
jgi:alpha-L-rhamnosidase